MDFFLAHSSIFFSRCNSSALKVFQNYTISSLSFIITFTQLSNVILCFLSIFQRLPSRKNVTSNEPKLLELFIDAFNQRPDDFNCCMVWENEMKIKSRHFTHLKSFESTYKLFFFSCLSWIGHYCVIHENMHLRLIIPTYQKNYKRQVFKFSTDNSSGKGEVRSNIVGVGSNDFLIMACQQMIN